MDPDLTAYRETIHKLAQMRSKELFHNGKPEHAAIIFEAFLSRAKKRVAILCRNLATDVFGNASVLTAIEAAGLKGVKVDFIVQEQPESEALKRKIAGWKNVSLLCSSIPSINSAKVNFATMDGIAYRFEPDKNKVRAYASMYNPDMASKLENVFYEFKAALVPDAQHHDVVQDQVGGHHGAVAVCA